MPAERIRSTLSHPPFAAKSMDAVAMTEPDVSDVRGMEFSAKTSDWAYELGLERGTKHLISGAGCSNFLGGFCDRLCWQQRKTTRARPL